MEVQVKATPVNALAAFVAHDLTPIQRQTLFGRLGPEVAQQFDGKLIATAYVPLELVDRFTTEAARLKGEPPFEFARRAGNAGAETGTRTVYKFIMTLLSPESVLRAAPLMWKRVYDSGSLAPEVGDHRGKLVIHDFPFSPALCGRITGWFEYIGKKAAANATTRHSSCRCNGDKECVWQFEW